MEGFVDPVIKLFHRLSTPRGHARAEGGTWVQARRKDRTHSKYFRFNASPTHDNSIWATYVDDVN